jgi:predicted RNase H-like HicB family nuclease
MDVLYCAEGAREVSRMGKQSLRVRAIWDQEAHCWVATSDDIPGLATGADTIEELVRKLEMMIPELLELNEVGYGDGEEVEIPFSVIAEATGQAKVRRPA